jgi:uncharacterized protein YndB with AHSA1/START domain
VISFQFDVEIDRPVDEVFAYATNPAHLHEWQTNTAEVEQLTEGPFGLGTRLREVHLAGRRRMEQVVEVTAYEPPHRFDLDIAEGPLPVDARHHFESTPDGGTVIRVQIEGRAPGPLRLVEPLLKLAVRRELTGHYARLKKRLESPRPPG